MPAASVRRMTAGKIFLIGCGVVVVIGGAIMAGFLVWLFTLPEGGVKLANEMDEYALAYLQEHHLLNSGELLVAYYDATLSMDGSEAIILTNQRVLHHRAPRTTAVELRNVEDIRHRNETLSGDIFEIISQADLPMKLEIAPLNGGETFHQVLLDSWRKAREHTPVEVGVQ
ncbi:MAG: hypothetical protein JXQ27_07240 [Acidobacteria bacterium]|nr:hypothetical protein [Acidobacteriota bacterium]